MTIRFKCTRCNTELNVADGLAGKQGKCPKCKSILTVPAPATAPAAAKVIKKKVEEPVEAAEVVEEEELVEAIVEEEEEEGIVAEVEEVEEVRPKRSRAGIRRAADEEDEVERTGKKKRRDVEDEEEAEDDRPRKKKRRDDDEDEAPRKKKRRDEDEDEEDEDRPRKKRRRDEDDEDDEDDDDNRSRQSPRQRRTAFQRAALGVQLTTIGSFVYGGALLLSLIALVVTLLSIQSAINSMKSGRPPSGGSGIETMASIFGWLIMISFFAAAVLHVVGASLTITTPARKGALGLSIATVATAGLSVVFFLWFIIKVLNVHASGGLNLGVYALNPFSGIKGSGRGGLGPGMGGADFGALLFLLPLSELGRLTCFAFYLWAVAKSTRDYPRAFTAMLLGIIVPSACAVIGLIMYIVADAMTPGSMGIGGLIAIFSVYFLAYIGVIVYFALYAMGAKGMLAYAR